MAEQILSLWYNNDNLFSHVIAVFATKVQIFGCDATFFNFSSTNWRTNHEEARDYVTDYPLACRAPWRTINTMTDGLESAPLSSVITIVILICWRSKQDFLYMLLKQVLNGNKMELLQPLFVCGSLGSLTCMPQNHDVKYS